MVTWPAGNTCATATASDWGTVRLHVIPRQFGGTSICKLQRNWVSSSAYTDGIQGQAVSRRLSLLGLCNRRPCGITARAMHSLSTLVDASLSLRSLCLAIASLSIVLLLSQYVYRLCFHPLSSFPGPGLAACSVWYEFYHDFVRGGQYTFEIKKMHDRHGIMTFSISGHIVQSTGGFYMCCCSFIRKVPSSALVPMRYI